MHVHHGGESVSVVIPTVNRPKAVLRAVESALNQTHKVHEVVVVIDGTDDATRAAVDALEDPRIVVLQNEVSRGPAAARNAGIGRASGVWVALLDDDDHWRPEKIERQLAALPDESEQVVMSCAVDWVTASETYTWPLRSPRQGEPVGEYLFTRTRPGEGFLATPTLLLRRELALSVPFPEHLRIHEDFDWLLRLEAAGASFHVVLESLVVVDGGVGRQSLSSQHDWQQSLSWALSQRRLLGDRAFSSFCLTEAARAIRGAGRVLASVCLLVVALTGLPRRRDFVTFAGLLLVPPGRQAWVRSRLGRA